jgi:hypothetical protein
MSIKSNCHVKNLRSLERMPETNPSRDRKVNRDRTNYSFCLFDEILYVTQHI